MSKPTLAELERLMTHLMLPFYQVERNAALPIEVRRFENDVEHCWSVAFMACSLAPLVDSGLDVGLVAQFGLIHDLVEVYAGDTRPWGEPKQVATKNEREAAAVEKLGREFGAFPWIEDTVRAYEARELPEAKFIWALDKVIILIIRHLDEGRYYVEAGITRKRWDDQLAEHRRKAHAHPEVGRYYDQLAAIFDEHPEYFDFAL